MYLTLKQHDQFRTLLMGFEVPFRSYVAQRVVETFGDRAHFENILINKNATLSPSDPAFLRQTLPSICTAKKLGQMYDKFVNAYKNIDKTIIPMEADVPTVGNLNIVTFSFLNVFSPLYDLFGSYADFCKLAEKYRFARNKLDHPGCKTLDESDLVPVLSFVKDVCSFLEDNYFKQKNKIAILSEVEILQNRKIVIPIEKNNFADMPYGESRIVCRDMEIAALKQFIYGKPDDLRKRHSCCIFGYGGVGKTALALEVLKEIVQDIQDNSVLCEYAPKYVFFFSAKKKRLDISQSNGKIIEKVLYKHFSNAEELCSLIFSSLQRTTLKGFHDEGLIIVDNLEALSEQERKEIKQFIELQTPAEMQFILTSRNSEDYEQNIKLSGFEQESGHNFVQQYIQENALDISLTNQEINELLLLSKGNTLVLVLCLRRLSQRLSNMSGLIAEFSSDNAWRNLRSNLNNIPGNAYEVISEFMFEDTFEEIEMVFSHDMSVFYKILKIFAVLQGDSVDLNTICLLSKENYTKVEAIADTLCNYLILEKSCGQYSLNKFAEKYIINRFMPDASTYEELSSQIQHRERQIQQALSKLQNDIRQRPELAKIMSDWYIVTDSDKITAATMYRLYGDAKRECSMDSRLKAEAVFEELIVQSNEAESITAHPFIKFQKARILQVIDRSKILDEVHTNEIKKSFQKAIFTIKTVEQYSIIQQTKSYASLLWLYGQYLADNNDNDGAVRYLEESKNAFEKLNKIDQEYYQCITKLGTVYLNYYNEDRTRRLQYLRLAREISMSLPKSAKKLGKASSYATQLKFELQKYGSYKNM